MAHQNVEETEGPNEARRMRGMLLTPHIRNALTYVMPLAANYTSATTSIQAEIKMQSLSSARIKGLKGSTSCPFLPWQQQQ